MHKDLFFDLESDNSELEYNSDASLNMLISDDECEMKNEEVEELKTELVRLSKLKDL